MSDASVREGGEGKARREGDGERGEGGGEAERERRRGRGRRGRGRRQRGRRGAMVYRPTQTHTLVQNPRSPSAARPEYRSFTCIFLAAKRRRSAACSFRRLRAERKLSSLRRAHHRRADVNCGQRDTRERCAERRWRPCLSNCRSQLPRRVCIIFLQHAKVLRPPLVVKIYRPCERRIHMSRTWNIYRPCERRMHMSRRCEGRDATSSQQCHDEHFASSAQLQFNEPWRVLFEWLCNRLGIYM